MQSRRACRAFKREKPGSLPGFFDGKNCKNRRALPYNADSLLP